MIVSKKPCRQGLRCHDWRQCDACAHIRQAQIADVAELGAAVSPAHPITYAVVRSYALADFGTDREAFQRRMAKITGGGIWTVETGEISTGLHINILASSAQPMTAGQIAEAWPVKSPADIWAAPVPRQDVRHVAAYISKRKGIPPQAEYSGRVYGSWGQWKRPLGALIEDPQKAPLVAAAALESVLAGAGVPAPAPAPAPAQSGPLTQEQLREKHLARLCAIYRGELELKESVWVSGFGLVFRSDAERLGIRLEKTTI